ncbi:MAG: succinylglutamate desuccinylase/aspartoacylase family protein [Planctomycetota bacterium]
MDGDAQLPFEIAGHVVDPGEKRRLHVPAAQLPTHTSLEIPITVVNGIRPGPVLWLSAALHGDELNGLEIIRLVLEELGDRPIRGALIALPIVNVLGFLQQSRYFPDRRDLNRSFPGSARGSLASRIAHLFMTEVVGRSTHGIDLHTASTDKSNFPQIRGNLKDAETRRCAEAFAAPITIHSIVRNGSLRAEATKRRKTVLVYEAGEPQRFNTNAIEIGVAGVLRTMRALGMTSRRTRGRPRPTLVVQGSSWIRARRGGLLRLEVDEGDFVAAKQHLGTISDPFGMQRIDVRAPFDGVVIGRTNNPVVNGGDAVVHVGKLPIAERPAKPLRRARRSEDGRGKRR